MTKTIRIVSQLLLRYRSRCIAPLQAVLVFCSLLFAWWLQFDFTLPYRTLVFAAALLLTAIRVTTLSCFGLLRGWWKYAGLRDGIDILKAVASGSIIFWVITQPILHLAAFPRSIYLLEAFLTTGLLVGVRLLCRILAESVREGMSSPGKKIVVIGAGSAAQTILREIARADSGYVAVGCLDDNRSKHGVRIHDVPVLGTVNQLLEIQQSEPVEEVLIAVPSATNAEMCTFIDICNQAKVKCRTVPALKDIISGRLSVSHLREVDLDDLLARQPVEIDLEAVREQIEGNRVMVTGAAGSIGSEICRQILDYGAEQLVCVDQNETGLFHLKSEHRRHRHGDRGVYRVANIRDCPRLRQILAEHAPSVTFHAAAYKHVPMMETNIHEAVENNVFALMGLLDEAQAAGCEDFVLISSDKAVNPSSAMGATKRIGELILSARPSNGMRCVSVRFGNVLGSSGSVVPVLKDQLRNHLPLTITHPEMMRFFMTTREAVALVLQAFAIGEHRDILVLEMGEQVRILDLARTLVRLSGKSEKDVRFEFTGLRAGEKLKEELFYSDEQVQATSSRQIKRARGASGGWPKLQRQLAELRAVMSIDGSLPIRAKIKQIVPEYAYTPAQEPVEVHSTGSAPVKSHLAGQHT